MARAKRVNPEDLRFLAEFRQKLGKKYEEFEGTDQEFARKLGVSRPALKKYLRGETMPGIRTVVLARSNLNIRLRYGRFDLDQIVGRARKNRRSPEAQMFLPFAIQSLNQESVDIQLAEKKPTGIALHVRIRFAS